VSTVSNSGPSYTRAHCPPLLLLVLLLLLRLLPKSADFSAPAPLEESNGCSVEEPTPPLLLATAPEAAALVTAAAAAAAAVSLVGTAVPAVLLLDAEAATVVAVAALAPVAGGTKRKTRYLCTGKPRPSARPHLSLSAPQYGGASATGT